MKCFKCGTEVAKDALFCPMCGESVSNTPRFCTHCGKPVDATTKFCENCGHEVQKLEKKTDLREVEDDVARAADWAERIMNWTRSPGENSDYLKVSSQQTASMASSTVHEGATNINQESGSLPQNQSATAAGNNSYAKAASNVHYQRPSIHQGETQTFAQQEPVQQAPVQQASAAPVASAASSVGAQVAQAAGKVAVEGVRKSASVGKTIAIWTLVIAFLVGAVAACLNFFVSSPAEGAEQLFTCVENLDFDGMLGCVDSTSGKQIRAAINLAGGILGAVTGVDMDFELLLSCVPTFAPFMDVPEMGVESYETVLYADCGTAKIIDYCSRAIEGEDLPTGYLSDNAIINFLQQYNISLPGIENLTAKTAIVKITMADGSVDYLPMVNEGMGDWRVLCTALLDSITDLG